MAESIRPIGKVLPGFILFVAGFAAGFALAYFIWG
jgi:hypothetical protein